MNNKPSIESLDGLIHKIRREGIERAQQEADALVAAAKQQAVDIVQAAELRAAQIAREAQDQIEKDATALRQAQQRAARDWLLTVRAALNELLQRLLWHECSAALTGPALEELIRQVAAEWMRHGGSKDIELLLNERDAQALTDSFLAQLQTELGASVAFKLHSSIHAGFKIGGQGQSMRFEFTDQALAESLAAYLHPRFAEVLDRLRQPKEGE